MSQYLHPDGDMEYRWSVAFCTMYGVWPVVNISRNFYKRPCLPRVAAQPQMTSFFKPYLSPRWRYCDVMAQLDKTPQWALGDHLRHGNKDKGSASWGYGVIIGSYWWPLATLLYLMCWQKRLRTFPVALIRSLKGSIGDWLCCGHVKKESLKCGEPRDGTVWKVWYLICWDHVHCREACLRIFLVRTALDKQAPA